MGQVPTAAVCAHYMVSAALRHGVSMDVTMLQYGLLDAAISWAELVWSNTPGTLSAESPILFADEIRLGPAHVPTIASVRDAYASYGNLPIRRARLARGRTRMSYLTPSDARASVLDDGVRRMGALDRYAYLAYGRDRLDTRCTIESNGLIVINM